MKLKSSEQKVRDRILSDGYGKFDLVEDILTKEEILNLKPRIVLKNITERLSIPEDKINRKTFWSWLSRYKDSNKPSFHHIIKETTVNSLSEKANQEWIKNFKPSIPKVVEREPVVIKVIRSDANSQNQ
ncbi:MAG TPA: hypothetical protein VFI29_22975 [Hanamia sp.]|nr:hypothetical protein [Hanamia sp.]